MPNRKTGPTIAINAGAPPPANGATNSSSSASRSPLPSFWRHFLNNPKSVSSENIITVGSSGRRNRSAANPGSARTLPGDSSPHRPHLKSGLSHTSLGKNSTEVNQRASPHAAPLPSSDSQAIPPAADEALKHHRDDFLARKHAFSGRVFGVSLVESLSVASAEVIVQSELVSFGRIPTVVAKCGAYLKANALETSGIFRIAGNSKRIKELQYIFSSPPDYGMKFNGFDHYSVHDVASLLRRFLNNLEEPLIPLGLYEKFREPLQKRPRILKYMTSKDVSHPNSKPDTPEMRTQTTTTSGNAKLDSDKKESTTLNEPHIFNETLIVDDEKAIDGDNDSEEEAQLAEKRAKKKISRKKKLARDIRSAIKEYEELLGMLTNDFKQLTIYLFDLLSLFSRQSQFNLMTSRNLAAIFQPSILSHPQHDMDPKEYELSRFVVEFLIEYAYKLLPHLLKLARKEQQENISKHSSISIKPLNIANGTAGSIVVSNEKDKVVSVSHITNSEQQGGKENILNEEQVASTKLTETGSVIPNDLNSRSNNLTVPYIRRPHSRSIGSSAVPPDVIASNKRRSKLFPRLRNNGILSDAGENTATEGEYDDGADDEYGDINLSQPNNRSSIFGKMNRSVSGNSSKSGSAMRPISMILTGGLDDFKLQRPKSPLRNDKYLSSSSNREEEEEDENNLTKPRKRESWFQRFRSPSHSSYKH